MNIPNCDQPKSDMKIIKKKKTKTKMNMKSAPCVVHMNTTSMLINLKSDPNNFLEKKIIKIKIKRDLIAQNRERERERERREKEH
jgi:hypothetical protein